MTALERRCRLLLRVYPAAYRQGRGEEIIGTLLEATPAGRSWPLARDVRALAAGGLQARAAVNRRLTTAANLRMAVVVGAAMYLACSAASNLILGVWVLTRRLGYAHLAAWPLLLEGALVGLAVALVWVSSRKAVLAAGMMAAAVAVSVAGPWQWLFGWPVPELACLGTLALLAGRDKRPGRIWLAPVLLAVSWLLVAYLRAGVWPFSPVAPLEALGLLGLLWVVIDARPAIAMAVFLLADLLPVGISGLVPPFDLGAAMPMLIVIPLAAVAVWQLHRQSARISTGTGT